MDEALHWHRRQVQALIDLGDSPLDAERYVAQAEMLGAEAVRFDVAQVEAMARVTDADLADARADWYARRSVPLAFKRLLDAKVIHAAPQ